MNRIFSIIGLALALAGAAQSAHATAYSESDRASMWARSGNLTNNEDPELYARVEVDWIEQGAFDDPNDPQVVGISACIAKQYPRYAVQMASGKWKPEQRKGIPEITLERYVFMLCSYGHFRNEIASNPEYKPQEENIVVPYNEFIGDVR